MELYIAILLKLESTTCFYLLLIFANSCLFKNFNVGYVPSHESQGLKL